MTAVSDQLKYQERPKQNRQKSTYLNERFYSQWLALRAECFLTFSSSSLEDDDKFLYLFFLDFLPIILNKIMRL